MTEKRKKIIAVSAVLVILAAAVLAGVWLYINRFIPEDYVQAVLDVSYKKQTEGYMEITGASAEEAEQPLPAGTGRRHANPFC